ncbi:hypothetical protein [Fusobacterium sp.]|uniref:hypothetical protein n=1 Tax=Fusobacterium sp. TaxID=68766 RepID=UPI002E76A82E|nr:hypothetical protein [Fusobacterium sp.]MEE1476421.1 hypothetical protein [Fusobacterium sp.]
MTHIYDNNLKFLLTLNYEYEDFIKNPQKFYPEWQTSYYATQEKYEHPIVDQKTNSLREMSKYEKFKAGLYELAYNEVEYKNDILTLEAGQYVNEAGELVTVPKIEGVRVEWDWINHIWEDKASNLEIVQSQYSEYEGMDTPSTLEEMRLQDPSLATEYLNMMIELRGLIYTLSVSGTQSIGYAAIQLPVPSEKLKQFKDKFKRV